MENLNQEIGTHLRTLRHAHGWSMDELATASGISKAMLGQIERGESSPTLVTLWKLTRGFNTPLSDLLPSKLLMPQNDQQDDELGEQPTVKTLLAFDPILRFEQLEISLPPECVHQSVAHHNGVVEVVNLIQGCLAVQVGDDTFQLNRGDTLRFEADQPHSYINMDGNAVVFINTVCYPAPNAQE